MIRVKICCIASLDEARLAVRHGASALGLVSAMPSGPGVIDDKLIAEIAAAVPAPVSTFLLTSRTEPEAIIEHARQCGTTAVQLVDIVEPSVYAALRRALPQLKIVQVLHVTDEKVFETARRIATAVDAILLDSGDPTGAVKKLGGTGRLHDWTLSRRIVETVACPVFLAGGLTPDNVGQAIDQVRPYAVDLCTGVRTDGRLDPDKLASFFAEVDSAVVRLERA